MKLKWILILFLIAAILFAPIPYYGPQKGVACIMMIGADCQPRAWQLGPSLWQKITSPQKPNPLTPQVCIQVITSAKDLKTGECRDFPTPCDVPTGWEKVQSCFYDAEGKFCGGIANIECPTDYKCQLDGSYPDAGGKCVRIY